jgi:peroxiredoxin
MTSTATPQPLELDSLVPDFALTSLDGESVSLSDYRGRKAIVFMWASW